MTDTPKTNRRLAVVLSHPTQYYSPWFQWLRAHTPLEFRVFYLWDFGVTRKVDPKFGTEVKWDVDLLSGYDSEFVPNTSRNPGAETFLGFWNPELGRRLGAWRPDAVLLFGYKWASHVRAVAWCRMHGVPILFRGDSNLIGRASPPLHVVALLRILFSQMDAFLYVGAANREYFEAFGVPAAKLFFAPHSVNNALYDPGDPAAGAQAASLRESLGIAPGTKVILFAGKLVEAKQPRELLRAFLSLGPTDTALVFVGQGPDLQDLLMKAEGHPSVHFMPFANQSEMPSRYLMADVFVLPSSGVYETWGLAINEAMHMGIPCLVSDRVGCQSDLVIEGETGWVFEASVPGALQQALSRALRDIRDGNRLREIRGAVSRKISGYSYARTSEGLQTALTSLRT